MTLFVFKPDPEEVAREAKRFAEDEVNRTSRALDVAKANLERAESVYDVLVHPGWKDEQALAAAQEGYDAAEGTYTAAVLRHEWENGNRWKNKPRANASYTKKLLSLIDWVTIFKGRSKR